MKENVQAIYICFLKKPILSFDQTKVKFPMIIIIIIIYMNMSDKTADLPLYIACFACLTKAEIFDSPGRSIGHGQHPSRPLDNVFIIMKSYSVNYTFETREIVCRCLVIPLRINIIHTIPL